MREARLRINGKTNGLIVDPLNTSKKLNVSLVSMVDESMNILVDPTVNINFDLAQSLDHNKSTSLERKKD